MAGSVVRNLFQLAIFINSETNGWSESWWLREQDRTSALATAKALVEARSWILAKDHVIEWAEIRQHVSPRNIQALIDGPLQALPQWDYSHDDVSGLLFRFDADNGRFAMHLIRGLEDGEIRNERWTRYPFPLPSGIAPRPAVPELADKADLLRYALTMFRERTVHREVLDDADDGSPQWNLTPWVLLKYRHVSTGPYGSQYQRVSAEWADYERAADYSYCGTVCGVQRTCRVVDCYPYSDGPVNHLRFYFAIEGATVFPHPTIFWGQYRDKEETNTSAPGEIKGRGRTPANPSGVWEYSIGASWGAAPGITWTGPPSRFLGLDPSPYASFDDVPPEDRPECDQVVFSFTIDDARPNTINVNNAKHATFERRCFIITPTGDLEHEVTVDLASLQERGELAVLFAHRSAFA